MFALTPIEDPRREFGIFDDFTGTLSGVWSAVNDGATGTNTVNDALGGTYSIVTAAADNDYHFIVTKKLFKFQNVKGLLAVAKLTLTEANTDDANIVFGLSSDAASTLLGADGAGPPSSYTGALFFKVDGGTVWQFETSNATAQVTNTSAGTFTSAASYELAIAWEPINSTMGKVVPYINGVMGTPHLLSLTSVAAMAAVVGVKAGAANAETLTVDYVGVRASR